MALAQGGSRKETKPVGAGAAKKEEKDEHILRAQMALEHGLDCDLVHATCAGLRCNFPIGTPPMFVFAPQSTPQNSPPVLVFPRLV